MRQILHGACSIPDLASIFKEMRKFNIKPDLRIYTDITDADLKGANYNSVSLLEKHLDEFIDHYLPVRKAIVVESLLEFGIARMYQTLAEKDGFEVQVFKCSDEAYRWLEN
ncbi:hypothetical protein [Malonomonas rubra]|nr:hypothetical protein [Malonomonas rubra]